jgi:hypothetical protein
MIARCEVARVAGEVHALDTALVPVRTRLVSNNRRRAQQAQLVRKHRIISTHDLIKDVVTIQQHVSRPPTPSQVGPFTLGQAGREAVVFDWHELHEVTNLPNNNTPS